MAAIVQVTPIPVGSAQALGIHIRLPGEDANLLVIRGAAGYLMCGYLNLEVAEEVGEAAAIVTGVATLEEMLAAPVAAATSQAVSLGVRPGMPGREALRRLVDQAGDAAGSSGRKTAGEQE